MFMGNSRALGFTSSYSEGLLRSTGQLSAFHMLKQFSEKSSARPGQQGLQ
jgi:hypothetical protein